MCVSDDKMWVCIDCFKNEFSRRYTVHPHRSGEAILINRRDVCIAERGREDHSNTIWASLSNLFSLLHFLYHSAVLKEKKKNQFPAQSSFPSSPCYISDHTVMLGFNCHFYQHLAIHTAELARRASRPYGRVSHLNPSWFLNWLLCQWQPPPTARERRGAERPLPHLSKPGPSMHDKNRVRVSGESRVFSEARICPLNAAEMVVAMLSFFSFFFCTLSPGDTVCTTCLIPWWTPG